ncbi:ataxin-7-like protein 1 isoform X2 [Periplaneta americana]|uniref:ataxin-7-like protein 1 isoform X2 n=1 Tax=Periplaneta americana TaxID=6978 RepID=UPI0037E981AB
MAAPSDSPTRFRGQPWSNWTDFLGRESPISDEDDPDRPEPDAMRLPKEDMGLFGLCPETDNFYVVICELCEACVKPQGLVNHMELWHKAETTDALPPPEPPEKISNSKGGTSKGSATNKLNVGNKVKVKRPVTAACSKLERATSNVEEQTSTETEKMTLPHTDLQQSSNSVVNAASSRPANQTATPAALLQPVVALTPLGSPTHLSSATATSAKSSVMATSPALISATSTLPNMAIDTSSSSFSSPSPCKKRPKVERKLPVKEREYDPDKHCGVWNGENSKPCTRSLTCKSHSLSMRRAVSGRSKHFDKLLADHRAAKDAAAKMKPVPSVPAVLGQSSPQETETNQAMSSPPPGRVGGSIQLDVPASPLPTSLSTPMSSPVMTPNSTPLANSALNPSASTTPFLSTLATTPLPSLPDLTNDTFEAHAVPAPASKAPLLSSVSMVRDPQGLGHSPGPPPASTLVTTTTITTAQSPSPIATVAVSGQSTTPTPSSASLPVHNVPAPSQSPSVLTNPVNTDTVSAPVSVLPKDLATVTIPSPAVTSQAAASISVSAASSSISTSTPLAISIPNSVLTPVPTSSLLPPHSVFQSNGATVNTFTSAVQMCDFPALFEDVTWLKNHPRPLAVCSFSGRKVGTLVCNTRRLEVVREGLRKALTHGPIRSPLSNDFYGNTGTNHAAGTIKTVLTNICTKSNFLSPTGKILVPNIGLSKGHKIPILPTPAHRSPSTTTLGVPSALKAVLPKPQHLAVKATLNHSVTCKDSVKNGQFHVPNILSGSLKRHAESSKSSGNSNSKRTKRKHTQNVNPAEIIGSLLARKNSRLGGRGNHVPLVTVAIANGLTTGSSSASQSDTSETKNVLSSRSGVGSDSLRTELSKGISSSNVNQISDGAANATNVKVSPNVQNVRIAAAPSTVQLATPQITYLTTGPVTFQQIPVLSPQVISQIQLQSKNSTGSQAGCLKLLSGGGGVSLATATAATTARTMVKDHAPSES